MHLWDPSLVKGHNHLAMIRDAVRRNHLGVLVEEEPVAVEPERLHLAAEHQWYAPPTQENREAADNLARELLQEHQRKTSELLSQQEMRIASLSQQHERELGQHRLNAEEQLNLLKAEVAALRQGLRREEEINAELRRELAGHVEASGREREELTAQLRSVEQQARERLATLRAGLQAEAEAKIAASVAQYREQVAIRDMELRYRGEVEQQLRQEIDALREERAGRDDGRDVLEQLAGLGMIFVVYHPGAGHLTIPLQDIARYQENPMAYAASKCLVSEERYRDWLAHYQQPTCEGRLSNGERCALPVDRVDTPGRFVEGFDNCCSRHRSDERQPGLR
ncbi:hypothetical protein D3C76_697240 [compost metagenome]